MFRIDECRHAARFLCLCDDVKRKRSFAGRFRSEDLDDASTGESADPERVVESDGAGRDCFHADFWCVTQLHNGILTKLRLNGFDCRVNARSSRALRLGLPRLLLFFHETCHGCFCYLLKFSTIFKQSFRGESSVLRGLSSKTLFEATPPPSDMPVQLLFFLHGLPHLSR